MKVYEGVAQRPLRSIIRRHTRTVPVVEVVVYPESTAMNTKEVALLFVSSFPAYKTLKKRAEEGRDNVGMSGLPNQQTANSSIDDS